MRVIATAGHVDHGKSTLVRALTGMEPDRWAEERRRGMTIDLGYAWAALDPQRPTEPVAFVDVPGHQRFVTNMLAGVGPVPAVLLVIAADDGWGRQTSEHLDAIDALGIRHGLVAVTRADRASAARVRSVLDDAIARLAGSSLGAVEGLAVSGRTGAGLPELRRALVRLLDRLPVPRPTGRVRLWVDRSFTVKGSGTVVTGTLGAGRISVGEDLELRGVTYPVKGLQQLGAATERVEAVARVAVNLRRLDRAEVSRGDCLLTPGAWRFSDHLDVEFTPLLAEPGGEQVLHIGSASIPVRVRMLGETTARLALARPIPVELGDRGVLRDPAQQSITAGVSVLDADPPALRRRGAARERAVELAGGGAGSLSAQVHRRGAVTTSTLRALGVPISKDEVVSAGVIECGDWLVDAQIWKRWLVTLGEAVDQQAADHPELPWLSEEAARRAVDVPDLTLLRRLAAEAGLPLADGRLGRTGARPALGRAEPAMNTVLRRLAANPYDAPERTELAELGLGPRELAASARTGAVLRLAADLVVSVQAPASAVETLRALPQPFTASQARQALGTTRRVALPLLEYLDGRGLTVRTDSSLRSVAGA